MDEIDIYVRLLDEGVDCVRPVPSEARGDGSFLLKPTANYDPNDEHWEFPPGSIVRCRNEIWEGRVVLVARKLVK